MLCILVQSSDLPPIDPFRTIDGIDFASSVRDNHNFETQEALKSIYLANRMHLDSESDSCISDNDEDET